MEEPGRLQSMGSQRADTTKWLHFHFSLSCIGEVNGNPLQCSCLENPRDGGAWWAAVYGVAQSRTRLKRLSSSSSSSSNSSCIPPPSSFHHYITMLVRSVISVYITQPTLIWLYSELSLVVKDNFSFPAELFCFSWLIIMFTHLLSLLCIYH